MSETFELHTRTDCTLETPDQNLYEAVDSDQHVENEYVAIKNISEGVTQKDDPIYNNTIMCSGTSECNDKLAKRVYKRPQHDGFDENERTGTISKHQAETATALRRLQIICIVLGAALVISSVTIGVLMLKMVSNYELLNILYFETLLGKKKRFFDEFNYSMTLLTNTIPP